MEQQPSKEYIRNTLQDLLEKGRYLTEEEHKLIPRGILRKEPLGVITREHVIKALNAYLSDEWAGPDIEDWANEAYGICRDYFVFEAGYGSVIDDILSQLASWGERLKPEEAQSYIQELQNAKYNPDDPTL